MTYIPNERALEAAIDAAWIKSKHTEFISHARMSAAITAYMAELEKMNMALETRTCIIIRTEPQT